MSYVTAQILAYAALAFVLWMLMPAQKRKWHGKVLAACWPLPFLRVSSAG